MSLEHEERLDDRQGHLQEDSCRAVHTRSSRQFQTHASPTLHATARFLTAQCVVACSRHASRAAPGPPQPEPDLGAGWLAFVSSTSRGGGAAGP